MIRQILPILFILFSQNISFSQSLSLDWRTFVDSESTADEIIVKTKKDSNNNIYIAGNLVGVSCSSDTLAYLVKLDSLGRLKWVYKDGGIYPHAATADIDIQDNYSLLLTRTKKYGNVIYTNNVVKIDNDGNKIWEKQFGNYPANYIPTAIKTSQDGSIYVVGTIDSSGVNNTYLAKLDQSGSVIWEQTYYTSSENHPIELEIYNNKPFIYGRIYNAVALYISSYDDSGNLLWIVTSDSIIPGSAGISGYKMHIDEQGYIYTFSSINTAPYTNLPHLLLTKHDTLGIEQWHYVFGQNMHSKFGDLIKKDTVFYLATANDYFHLIKIGESGYIHWEQNYWSGSSYGYGAGANTVKDIAFISNDKIGIFGSTKDSANIEKPYFVLCDTAGSFIGDHYLGSTSSDDEQGEALLNINNNLYAFSNTNEPNSNRNSKISFIDSTNNVFKEENVIVVSDIENFVSYGETTQLNYVTDNNDNVYLVGLNKTNNSSSQEIVLSKIANDGSRSWQKRLYFDSLTNNYTTEKVRSIDLDANGNIYIAGEYVNVMAILKTDPSGNLIWSKVLDTLGVNISGVHSIKIYNDNIYVAAETMPANTSYVYPKLKALKLDLDGNIIWEYKFNNSTDPYFVGYDNRAFVINGDKLIFPSTISDDAGIHCIDTNGVFLWELAWDCVPQGIPPNESTDFAVELVLDSVGSIYASVVSVPNASGANTHGGHSIIKVDELGNLIWEKIYADDGLLGGDPKISLNKCSGRIVYSNQIYLQSNTIGQLNVSYRQFDPNTGDIVSEFTDSTNLRGTTNDLAGTSRMLVVGGYIYNQYFGADSIVFKVLDSNYNEKYRYAYRSDYGDYYTKNIFYSNNKVYSLIQKGLCTIVSNVLEAYPIIVPPNHCPSDYSEIETFEVTNSELSIYPNPTQSDLFIISNTNEMDSFFLLNLLGELMETKKVNSQSVHLDLSRYPNGIYYVKVLLGNGSAKTLKVIKN